MEMRHLLLEVYCDCIDSERPDFCIRGIGWAGSHCFENNCKHLSYTNCPNEISYSGSTGLIETENDFVGFGGDMYPENCTDEKETYLIGKWKSICAKKIDEAYQEFKKAVEAYAAE